MESVNSSVLDKKRKKTLTWSLQSHKAKAEEALPSEVPTPEKPSDRPRRYGRRSLAFSLTDASKIDVGLHRGCNGLADRSVLGRSVDGDDVPSWPRSDSNSYFLGGRETVVLPEKYERLAEIFNSLDSSIRLLQLKRSMTTFSNIRASIQHLTERRFTHKHLAQMKHILPEAFSIKKVLLRDETTCCMKPELQISLLLVKVESKFDSKGESSHLALRKVFRMRLIDFAREHLEEDDIPEEELPHPFGQRGSRESPEFSEPCFSTSIQSSPATHCLQQMPTFSHIPPTFRRRFSLRTPLTNSTRTPLDSLNEVTPKGYSLSSNTPLHMKSITSSPDPKTSSSNTQKCERSSPSREIRILGSTPTKDSTPVKLMTITPELQNPKRSLQSAVNDAFKKEPGKRAVRTKLFPTPRKNENVDDADCSTEDSLNQDDLIGFLPESLLQDIRKKEKKKIEERNTGAAGERLRREMITCLPKLFDLVLLIFQSGDKRVITKQELVHKILSSHMCLVDKIEVEERLSLLEELIPDWISARKSIAGDLLYHVNKMSCPKEIRQRLAAAR